MTAQTPPSTLPPDIAARALAVAPLDDPKLPHVAVAGGVYTILVSGDQTDGRYALIDMLVPPGAGPQPHRHDFEEMFALLGGELEFAFRDETVTVRAGSAVNIPANAPHAFRNASTAPAHMLCFCAPAGQEKFFLEIGDMLPARSSSPPLLSDGDKAERAGKARALAAKYRTEFLAP
jgi:mannose-6-phosphate isomerase-like protein (cupin superfamily)